VNAVTTAPDFTPAAPAAIALRPLGLGELLDAAFAIYRHLFGALVALQVVCGLPGLAATIYADASGGAVGARFVALLFNLVFGSAATAATAVMIGEVYLGRSIGMVDALRRVTPRLGTLVLTSVLVGLATGLAALPAILAFGAGTGALASGTSSLLLVGGGLLLVGVAALFLPLLVFSATSLSTITLVLERLPSGTAAVKRSWALTAGARGRIMVLLFLLLVVIGALLVGIGAAYGLFVDESMGVGSPVLSILQALLQALLGPIVYCVLTLVYYDRRVRLEAFDLDLLSESLG
jgi:hypothetical protein